jgi:translocation and assembly module TamB
MSRRLWTWAIISMLIALVAGSGIWAFGTTQGSRWVIKTLLPVLPVKIEVKEIAGSFAGRLELKGISLHMKEWDLAIGSFVCSWQPLHFVSGNVAVREAAFQDITLIDKHPEVRRPVELAWPKPPLFLSWFSCWVDSFRIENFTHKSGPEELRLIDKLTTRVSWFFGDLSLKDLKIETPLAGAEGNLQTAFRKPFLLANLSVTVKDRIVGLDRFAVTINLKAASGQELMSGLIRIGCAAGSNERLSIAGKMGVLPHALNFTDLAAEEKGRKGRLLGKGEIDFSAVDPRINLQANLSEIDVSRELRTSVTVAGKIDFESDFRNYNGSYTLRNADTTWKKVELAGVFEGNDRELKSLTVNGKVLKGDLRGTLKAAWSEDIDLSGSIEARGIDPALITPDWKGLINADIKGSFRWSKARPFEGTVKAELLSSVLREKALTGKIDAQWRNGLFDLTRFDLHGNGFDLHASGVLRERLTYQAQVRDLSGLIPGSKGHFSMSGWGRWQNGQPAGTLKGRGAAISFFGIGVGEINMETSLGDSGNDFLQGKIKARDVAYGPFRVEAAEVKMEGRISNHNVGLVLAWPGSGVRASMRGGLADGLWQGAIVDIVGNDARFGAYKLSEPATLKVSADRCTIGSLVLTGGSSERLETAADLALHPLSGSIMVKWFGLNMARANGLLASPKVSGKTSGSFEAEWPANGSMRMTGSATIADAAVEGSSNLLVPKGEMKLDWRKEGLAAFFETTVGSAGRIEGRFTSDQPARMAMPETGRYFVTWKGLDVGIVKARFPAGIDVEGSMEGQAKGRLLPGSRLEMTGQTKLSRGAFAWKDDGGMVSAKAEEASLDMEWQNNALKGSFSVVLQNRGSLRADFQLPIHAGLPLRIDPEGPLRLSAKGEASEKGILTAIFPGLIGESEGQLSFDLTAGGSWQTPDLGGKVRLTRAAAYLNPTGIRIHDIGGEAELKGDRLNITSFRAVSGSGSVQGLATVYLGRGKILRYEGKLRGEKFQAIYLPELQVSANPDLSFEGDTTKFALRGTIIVPDALVRYEGKEGIIATSGDVVIVDAPDRQKKRSRMGVDMKVDVVLGDNVRIEAQGVNARLEGRAALTAQSFDRINADGRIQSVKGQYKRRGITLDIVRGRVVFAGKAVDLAALDVLAVRKVRDPSRFNDIQAGVAVTGTLRSPLVKLYSEPAMADADVLSYMVLGKPLSAGTESSQASLLMQAAGTLLAKDQSTSLQSQVMKFVGIDTIEVQAAGQSTGGQSTTTPQTGTPKIGSGQISSIQPTGSKASGSTAGTSAVASSIVTVGKYLSPDLYVAFGRSLFSDDYLATTRYSLFRHWEVEGSRRGVETGVDLYYKIEFK